MNDEQGDDKPDKIIDSEEVRCGRCQSPNYDRGVINFTCWQCGKRLTRPSNYPMAKPQGFFVRFKENGHDRITRIDPWES